MSRHANTFDATQKALAAARVLAERRLCAGAKALADVGKRTDITFTGPRGERLEAAIDGVCIVRVFSKATGELLAMSEPGRPDVLNAAYHPLTPQDLAPRLN